jgi:hypothetical protein
MLKDRRRILTYLLLTILIIQIHSIAVFASEIDKIVQVTRVIDGDSFEVSGDEVRLADVSAPEWNMLGGTEATNALINLISGKIVYLDTDQQSGRDPYGRLIAVVYIVHNSTHYKNVNEVLLRLGVVSEDDYTNNEFSPSTWTLFVRYASIEPPPPPLPTPPLPPFLSDLTVTPSEIELGDNVTIGLDVMNPNNRSITYIVTIRVEGIGRMGMHIEDLPLWVDVELEAYESKTVLHTITPDASGHYNVTVDGMTGIFTVKWPMTPAEFVVSNLTITQEVFYSFMGDVNVWNFKITVNVTNIGEHEGSHTVDLRVDDSINEFIASETVTLRGGETTLITFDVRRGVGSYTAEVDGLTGSFVVLNILKPAEIELSELEALGRQALIHDDEGRPIIEGEYVIFSVLVKNIGETEGTYIVEFKVDGETIDTYNWTLAAGRGHRAHAYYEALNVGTYQISVGNLTDTFTVRAPLEPAEFVFSNLQITPRVKIGMSVNISVDVTNVGEMMGFCTFDLKMNGRVVDSVEIPSFGGGVTATQFFELTRSEGTYEVEVEGLKGSFTVVKPKPSFLDKIPGFPYESIVMGILVVMAIWLIQKKR